jgi:hypothetical protein
MIRALFTAVFVSCILGVLLGFCFARGFLSINAWKPETETASYETLIQKAFEQVTNPNAQAHIEETVYNFGIMDVKSTGTHDFFIKNVGTEDLILVLDRTTCSCTGIDISPTRVPPGRTAKCHLRYNAEQAITGKFSQGGIILTNDPNNREIQLLVEGIFTNPVVLRPSSVNLPRVEPGTSRTATIRFYGYENEPLQISSPTWGNREHFDFQWKTAEFDEIDINDSLLSLATSVVEGTITIKPGLPVGKFDEWFQVKTNYQGQVNVSFLVSGQIVGNVTIRGRGFDMSRGIADLGNTVVGRKILREFSVQFSGSAARSASLQVKEVEPAWIRTELFPPTDAGQFRVFPLIIEIPENAPTGNYVVGDGQQAHVLLETSDENMPVIKIPLKFSVSRQ